MLEEHYWIRHSIGILGNQVLSLVQEQTQDHVLDFGHKLFSNLALELGGLRLGHEAGALQNPGIRIVFLEHGLVYFEEEKVVEEHLFLAP